MAATATATAATTTTGGKDAKRLRRETASNQHPEWSEDKRSNAMARVGALPDAAPSSGYRIREREHFRTPRRPPRPRSPPPGHWRASFAVSSPTAMSPFRASFNEPRREFRRKHVVSPSLRFQAISDMAVVSTLQFHGSNSSIRLLGCAGIRLSTSQGCGCVHRPRAISRTFLSGPRGCFFCDMRLRYRHSIQTESFSSCSLAISAPSRSTSSSSAASRAVTADK